MSSAYIAYWYVAGLVILDRHVVQHLIFGSWYVCARVENVYFEDAIVVICISGAISYLFLMKFRF
jgi:hypothetical protein